MNEPARGNLVLIGYRGSGKTTVGREAARRLGYALVDTDERIVAQAGMAIAEIFDVEKEAGFRKREARVVRAVMAGDRQVISMGGGAILQADNVACMRERGFVVWLKAPAEVLWERIEADSGTAANRPALTSLGGLDEIRSVLGARAAKYKRAAHTCVDASMAVGAVVDAVIAAYAPGR
ncbi:MAG: AAA family ATPase [Phycisphaerales bacterium]|nr:MAG: AAA family ATPase [Phycisphaerales bacterium]